MLHIAVPDKGDVIPARSVQAGFVGALLSAAEGLVTPERCRRVGQAKSENKKINSA